MFFHGIDLKYVEMMFPILAPRRTVFGKTKEQQADRKHLIERFGLEPVHLLEVSNDYPVVRCLKECFVFGDTVFAFRHLPLPLWQLSRHEIGVPVLNLAFCEMIFTKYRKNKQKLKLLFPDKTIFVVRFLKKQSK